MGKFLKFCLNNQVKIVLKKGASDNRGYLGINTADPKAPLHITGSGEIGLGAGDAIFFKFNTIDANLGTTINGTIYARELSAYYGTWNHTGIYSNWTIVSGQSIVSHNGVVGASDERIKKDIVDIDDGSALETLRLLKPKQYKYKDSVRGGFEPVWGFIAQEVRETLPYATTLRQDCIPSIYELASVSNSNVITFTNFDTSTLESNASVLKIYDTKDDEHLITINEVIDGHTIRVEEDLSEWIGSLDETGNVVAGNQIFVYGEQVDDFVFLKKESIFTVATAALQEVDRQLQTEKEKVKSLEERLATLEAIVLNK